MHSAGANDLCTLPTPSPFFSFCTMLSYDAACTHGMWGTQAAAPASTLQGLLGTIGKKSKMSTVTKTALDWDSFKSKEGIGAELVCCCSCFLYFSKVRVHFSLQKCAWETMEFDSTEASRRMF
jgi:hypothetical protein